MMSFVSILKTDLGNDLDIIITLALQHKYPIATTQVPLHTYHIWKIQDEDVRAPPKGLCQMEGDPGCR